MTGTVQQSAPAQRVRWAAPGPVADAFMADTTPIIGLNGPIGSGKTTAAIIKGLMRAQTQRAFDGYTLPGPDGTPWPVRRRRLTVVRDTYRQLWRSTIPSWQTRFPKTVGDFTGADNAPATHRLTFVLPDRTLVEWQADFVAIGDNAIEDVLRGYETSDFYLNETDLLSKEVFTYAIGRYGRFPAAEHGGCDNPGIIFDCNAPELESWLYTDIFLLTPAELRAKGIALYRQPGGMDPRAENLNHLNQTQDTLALPYGHPERIAAGRAYYERQITVNEDWYVQRMVHNKPGYSRAGKPVYPEFNDQRHVALTDHPGVPQLTLIIGLDAGMQPAAVFKQRLPSGRWLILDELVSEPGTGPKRFGATLAQRLRERFPNFETITGICDPSALYGADRKAGEKDWSEIVAAEAGIRIRPAPTNDPVARWEAVRRPLTLMPDGEPAFQLNPRCKVLRSGFNAGYRFRKIAGTTNRFNTEQAEKTAESHPHDALQYGMSWGGEDIAIRRRRGEDEARVRRMPTSSPPYDPYAAHAAGG